MKVLHLGKYFPPHRGGMETHLQTLTRGLASYAAIDVIVAASNRQSSQEDVNGVRVTRASRLGAVAATPICPSLLALVRQSKPDLVHIHHPHPFAMMAYLVSGASAPLVITYQSDIVRQRILGKAVAPMVEATLRRASAIFVTSQEYLDTSPVLSRHREKCRLVPMGIEIGDRKCDRQLVKTLRNRFGSAIVLSVGRLVSYKGLQYLVRAMRDVSATLVVIGSGPEQRRLESIVKRFNLQGRVHLIGDVDDIEPYYDACDIFVLPSISRNEAFGLVQLEAMAAGKPVINTALDSGVPFVSRHNETGFTVRPRDESALADAINLLLKDSALADRFGRAAHARLTALFSADAMVRRTFEVYEQVLGKRTQGIEARIESNKVEA